MSNISEDEKKQMIKVSDEAFGEFMRDGKVRTVCCHKCVGLIEIKALSASAWRMSCPCGKYNGDMKGL